MRVVTQGLGKRYGALWAVRDLDLVIPHGTVTGFIGPNGAGKTTIITMLAGLVRPTAGSVEFGSPLSEAPRVRAVLDRPAFFPWLSARENLRRLAGLEAPPAAERVEAALIATALVSVADRPAGTFSTGMAKRLAIAFALLDEPHLLLLDEPFDGLDPESRIVFRSLVRDYRGRGGTVLLSSHQLGEIEGLADHLAFIDRGRLVRQGATERLLEEARTSRCWRLEAEPRAGARDVLLAWPREVLEPGPGQPERELLVRMERAEVPEALARLARSDVRVYGVTEQKPGLEELFVRMSKEAPPAPPSSSLPPPPPPPPPPPSSSYLPPLPTFQPSLVTLAKFELRKLLGRRRNLALLLLPSTLLLFLLFGLPLVRPFLDSYRTKFLIPALTGCATLGLSFARYVYPFVVGLWCAEVFAAEAANGTLATTLLTGVGRLRLFAAKLVAVGSMAALSLSLTFALFAADLLEVRLFTSPDWWRAFNYPVASVLRASFTLLAATWLCQLALVGYWSLFAVPARGTVLALTLGLGPLAVLGVVGVVAPELNAFFGLPWDPSPTFFTTQYAAVGDFDLLDGAFNHGTLAWPPFFLRRSLPLLVFQGLACAVLAAALFRRRDVSSGREG